MAESYSLAGAFYLLVQVAGLSMVAGVVLCTWALIGYGAAWALRGLRGLVRPARRRRMTLAEWLAQPAPRGPRDPRMRDPGKIRGGEGT